MFSRLTGSYQPFVADTTTNTEYDFISLCSIQESCPAYTTVIAGVEATITMKLNKTVYLIGGDTKICEYDDADLDLYGLWMVIFVLSVLLNLAGIFGNLVVIVACFLQQKKTALITYIQALAFSDLLYALLAPFTAYR